MQYIFGYGSLIDTQNRSLTLPLEREVVPAHVQRFERSWNVPSIFRSFTVLGVRLDEKSYCNGVLFPLSRMELEELDFREQKYRRVEILKESIDIYHSGKIEGKVWTYTPEEPKDVSRAYPLAQTYLDIVLRGSLEFGEEFAREFIRTTQGWSEYWVNDREEPRTRTTIRNEEIERKIDEILQEEVAEYFSQRI